MSNKPNQIIFKVRLLGIISAIFLILALLFIIIFLVFHQKYKQTTHSIGIYKLLQNDALSLNYLKERNFEQISDVQLIKEIKHKQEYLLSKEIFRQAFYSGNIQIYLYKDYYYYSFALDKEIIWFKNNTKSSKNIFLVSFLIFLMAFGLFMLQKTITKTLKSVYELQDSKELFLRNIMHEFKTPLTRITFHVHSLDNSLKQKQILLNQCSIITEYLDKFKQIEQLESTKLNIKRYTLIDILEDIQEHLLSKNISHNINTQILNIDYEYFFIVLKNLLDNGLKYSLDSKVYLSYKNDKLFIYNRAKKLKQPFSSYTQAFQRGEANSVSGMGLGLYISYKILEKHNISMKNYQIAGIFYLVLDLKRVL